MIVIFYTDYFFYLVNYKKLASKYFIKAFRRHILIEAFIETFLFTGVGYSCV